MRILTIFLLCFLNIFSVFAEDEKEAKITKISYSDYFDISSLITLTGTNLDLCDDLSYKSFNLKILESSATKISFKFNELSTSGTLVLSCKGSDKIFTDFDFPNIDRVTIDRGFNEGKTIKITGNDFGDNPTVYMDGGTFTKTFSNNRSITGVISGNFLSSNIYIISEGFKSNLYKSELIIPKINYIRSYDDFLNETDIFIYGENLLLGNELELFIDDIEYSKVKKDKNNGYLKVELSKDIGNMEIYAKYRGVVSNIVTIKVIGDKVTLNKGIEKFSDSEDSKNKFIIEGNNFPENSEELKVYLNGNKVTIDNYSKKEIELSDFDLKPGENIFFVIVNGVQSNSLYKFKEYDLPSISGISGYEIKDGKKIFSLSLNNYKLGKDQVYFNNGAINPIGCFGTICRFSLAKSTLKGSFTISRDNIINPDSISFDHTNDNKPYIEKIVFSGDIKPDTKFKISGNSLNGITLTAKNLFSLSDNDLSYTVNGSTISGRLPRNYILTSPSSVSVSKNGQTSSFSFNSDELKGNTILAAPYLQSIYNKSDTILAGDSVILIGNGFNRGDRLMVGTLEIILNNPSNTRGIANIEIPEDLKPGLYNIYIINRDNKKSNSIPLYILDSENDQLDFTSKDTATTEFELRENYNDSVYSIWVTNNIKDIDIKEITFVVDEYNVQDYLGDFSLYLNNVMISQAHIDKKGNIVFSDKFTIAQSVTVQDLSLRKNGFFHTSGEFKISLHESKFKLRFSRDDKYINDQTFSNLFQQSIIVNGIKKFDCYDEKNNFVFCNDLLDIKTDTNGTQDNGSNDNNQTLIQEVPADNSDTINNQITVLPTKSQLDIKLDRLLNNLYNKQSKKTITSQLSYYKNLKYKLSLIVNKLPEGKNKQLVTYINDGVNIQYKKVFKQFILDKRNK